MAIEQTIYLTYTESVVEHIELMRRLGEVRYGVFDRTLLQSALARPEHAAAYGPADLPAQAATLCFGLIKNHPFVGGNKRTATHLTDRFLKLNGWEISAPATELAGMVLAIEVRAVGRCTPDSLDAAVYAATLAPVYARA